MNFETIDEHDLGGIDAVLERRESDSHTSGDRKWFLVLRPEGLDGPTRSPSFDDSSAEIKLDDAEAGWLLKYAGGDDE